MNPELNDTVNITPEQQPRWWKRSLLPVIVAAALGAIGGGPGYRMLDNPREYPFTSVDGKAIQEEGLRRDTLLSARLDKLEDAITKRLDRMNERANALNDRVADLPPRGLLERVTRLEERQTWLEKSTVRWANVPTIPGKQTVEPMRRD